MDSRSFLHEWCLFYGLKENIADILHDKYFVRTGEQLANFNVKVMVRDSQIVEVVNKNSISMLRGSILQYSVNKKFVNKSICKSILLSSSNADNRTKNQTICKRMKVVDEIMDDLGEENASDPVQVLASLEQRRRETHRLRGMPLGRGMSEALGSNLLEKRPYQNSNMMKAKSVGDVSSQGLTLAELIAQKRRDTAKSNLSLEENMIYKKDKGNYLVASESCIVRPIVIINSDTIIKQTHHVDKQTRSPNDPDYNSSMPPIRDSVIKNTNIVNNNSKRSAMIRKAECGRNSIETPQLLPEISTNRACSKIHNSHVSQGTRLHQQTVADLYSEHNTNHTLRNNKVGLQAGRTSIGGNNALVNQERIAKDLITSLDE